MAEEDLKKSLDVFFLVVMGAICLFLQCGFAFLEAGSVRSKNASNILIKNLLDSFVSGLAYYTIGFAFAYGSGNSFIGYNSFALKDVSDGDLAVFFFQYVFAATAATIVSGAVAERVEFVAYLVYSFIITGFMYPVVTHWVWTEEGWLAKGANYSIQDGYEMIGYSDFAGSGAVHALGGVAAFCGAWITGPRIGRFHTDTKTALPVRGHSVPFAALGGFILIFGFMAFNGGSQMSISNPGDPQVVGLVVTNTVLAGSGGAFMSLILTKIKYFGTTHWSLLATLNGCLTGMVSICASCSEIRPWGAVIVGGLGGIIYKFLSWLMIKAKIDDPLDAVSVHFGGGFWGVIAQTLFIPTGILYKWDKRSGLMFSWNLCGIVAITVWTFVLSSIMFGILKVLGLLRVSPELEKKGLDIFKHGEPAYPLESYGHGYIEKILKVLDNGALGNVELGFLNGGHVGPYDSFESHEVKSIELANQQAMGTPEVSRIVISPASQ